MKLGNKEIKDECSRCGEVLTCQLCADGHGIRRERSRVAELVNCQLEHMKKREKKDADLPEFVQELLNTVW